MPRTSGVRTVMTLLGAALSLSAAALAESALTSQAAEPTRNSVTSANSGSDRFQRAESPSVPREATPPGSTAASRAGSSPAQGGASNAARGTPGPALVTTVSVPGGLSEGMRASLGSLEGLFARSSGSLESTAGPGGARTLRLGAGFLNVAVARRNPDGSLTSSCVSSLGEAVRLMQPQESAHDDQATTKIGAQPAPEGR